MIRIQHVVLLACIAAPACKSSDAKETAPKTAEANAPAIAEEAPAAPSDEPAWREIPQFKLQLLAPPIVVTDSSEGNIKQVAVTVGDTGFTLGPVNQDLHKTLEGMIKAAMADDFSKQNITFKEKLADGFHFESVSESGLVTLEVQRTIGGVTISCGGVQPDEANAKVVRAACLSLKAM